MVCTYFQCLGLPHDQPNLCSILVLKKLYCSYTTLLPLIPILVKPVQLRLPAGSNI